jgi:peptide-methionine (R)-S-oxide reductase
MTSELPDDEELRARLSDEQYRVTQQKGTERAFTGAYVDHKADGTYRCVCCDAELFSSVHKYDSGSGWPSFWLSLAGDAKATHNDITHTSLGAPGYGYRMGLHV